MKKYKVADIVFLMEPDITTEKQAEKYEYSGGEEPLFTVKPRTLEEYNSKPRKCSFEIYQYLTLGNAFIRQLYKYNGFQLHASAVVVDGKAYLFSAPSGTGKSTHTRNWLKLFKERSYILNDDKPAIRVLDSGIYAYGTPWSGKNDVSVNTSTKLQGICFLQRDETNWIARLPVYEALEQVVYAALRPLDKQQAVLQLEIIDKVINNIPIFSMGCTPTIEAAQMAYDEMSKVEV